MQEIVFVAQKAILQLLFPAAATLLFLILGLILWRRRTWSFVLVFVATAVLATASFPLMGLMLVRSIETSAGDYADPNTLQKSGVKHIVVLSGGFRNGNVSSTDRIGCSMLRLAEGVRLFRQVSGAKLVLTGGVTPGLSHDMSIAQALGIVAEEMGVPRNAMILEQQSWTTEDQGDLVATIVGKAPFALVTSAFHMPRSMAIFRARGLNPIPAPCDFLAKKIYYDYGTLMPSAEALAFSEIAIKEYLLRWYVLMKARLFR